MKKLFFTSVLFCFALVCFAQKNMFSEDRQIAGFSEISVSEGIDVYITEGTSSSLRVETNIEDELSRISTKVVGNKLVVSRTGKSLKNIGNLRMKVHVTAKNLKSIEASSGADVYSTGQLQTGDINLSASSGADITLDLQADNVYCESTSGGDVTLKGNAKYAKLSASSGADIIMKDMKVAKVDAEASSGADISIYVTEELNADASSSGDIIYTGSPKIVNKKTSSSGDISGK